MEEKQIPIITNNAFSKNKEKIQEENIKNSIVNIKKKKKNKKNFCILNKECKRIVLDKCIIYFKVFKLKLN